MPLLAAFIGNLWVSFVGFLATHLTKRVALVLAAVTLIAAAVATFVATISGLWGALSATLPPEVNHGLSWIVPRNLDVCISTVITAYLARWTYDWNVRVVQIKLNV